MIFRQLFDPQSSTYTYLLADPASREGVLIDPVFEQARRDAALIDELGLKLKWTLETQAELVDERGVRSEEHTSELQSLAYLVCRLLLEKKKKKKKKKKPQTKKQQRSINKA